MDMATVIALLQQQQKEMAEQRELLQTQSRQIDRLKQEIDACFSADGPSKDKLQLTYPAYFFAPPAAADKATDGK